MLVVWSIWSGVGNRNVLFFERSALVWSCAAFWLHSSFQYLLLSRVVQSLRSIQGLKERLAAFSPFALAELLPWHGLRRVLLLCATYGQWQGPCCVEYGRDPPAALAVADTLRAGQDVGPCGGFE